jgi:hypothetical protein
VADFEALSTWQHLIQINVFNCMVPVFICVLVLHKSDHCRADIGTGVLKKVHFYNAACR